MGGGSGDLVVSGTVTKGEAGFSITGGIGVVGGDRKRLTGGGGRGGGGSDGEVNRHFISKGSVGAPIGNPDLQRGGKSVSNGVRGGAIRLVVAIGDSNSGERNPDNGGRGGRGSVPGIVRNRPPIDVTFASGGGVIREVGVSAGRSDGSEGTKGTTGVIGIVRFLAFQEAGGSVDAGEISPIIDRERREATSDDTGGNSCNGSPCRTCAIQGIIDLSVSRGGISSTIYTGKIDRFVTLSSEV